MTRIPISNLVSALALAVLTGPQVGADGWSSTTWNGEQALTSSSGSGWRAVVSVERGRLIHFGPEETGRNLLFAPEVAEGWFDISDYVPDVDPAPGLLERFSHYLRRGQDVIGELMSSLDHTPSPQLAVRLERLYEFMLFQLTEANHTRAAGPVRQVTPLLARVYDAFRHVILNPTPEVRSILASPPRAR